MIQANYVSLFFFLHITASDIISLYEGLGTGQFGPGGNYHGDGRRVWSVRQNICLQLPVFMEEDTNMPNDM